MKKIILVTSLMFLLAAGPAMAQMMGGGQMMGSGQDAGSNQQMMEHSDARTSPLARKHQVQFP